MAAARLSPEVIEDLRLLSGLEPEEAGAPAEEVANGIAEGYQVTVEQMVHDLGPENGARPEGRDLHDIEVMANEPTAANLVNVIISTALRERASDIHLLPFESAIQLRYRVDGLFQEKSPPPKPLHAELRAQARGRGQMVSLFEDGLRKAAAGMTSLEEIVRVCSGDVQA